MEHLANDFWNIRGDFRIAKVLNVGTHMSLVRRPSGKFLLLDSYETGDADHAELMALTDGGSQIEAVLNVHPFHTVHCKLVQETVPNARLIGTRRHRQHLPNLPWDPALIEDSTTQEAFSDVLDFTMPFGVDFISDDEGVHVGSVIVRHRQSGVVHADDTLNVLDLPNLIQKLVPGPQLRFHPKLAEALEKRPGAADDYIAWARDMARSWADTEIVCTAHSGIFRTSVPGFTEAIEQALEHASDTLDKHRKTYG